MRILFCNIAWMERYDGNEDGTDKPHGGGAYVELTGDAHEKYNFTSEELLLSDSSTADEYCLGFVETKSTNGTTINQLNIEKISGCEHMKREAVSGIIKHTETVNKNIQKFATKYTGSRHELYNGLIHGIIEANHGGGGTENERNQNVCKNPRTERVWNESECSGSTTRYQSRNSPPVLEYERRRVQPVQLFRSQDQHS